MSVVTTPVTSVLDAVLLLARTGGVMEVRVLKTSKGTQAGYFETPEAAAAAIGRIQDRGSVYLTLNPVHPALLARAVNRLKPYPDALTQDSDILERRWFPIDVDSVRPKGISATESELQAALARRDDLVAWLTDAGWPTPALAMSGNGGHALFAVDLPNTQEMTILTQQALKVLAHLFGDAAATVDESVFNASRIWKVYGTLSRKGDATADRPHRRSAIESAPETFSLVTLEQLQGLADQLPTAARAKRSPRRTPSLDLTTEFDARGWYLKPLAERRHAVRCPWSHLHSGDSGATETALFEPPNPGESWGFKCLHAHCAGRTIRDIYALLRSDTQPPGSAKNQPIASTADFQPGLAALLDEVVAFFRRYVVLTTEQADTLALWVAHSHAIDAADTTPYLSITSATRREGKTRTLEVAEYLVAHPWLTARVSAAALVRKIHGERPTLLLDETDAAFKHDTEYSQALRSILNSGYRRKGRSSLCVRERGSFISKDFKTFCPKAIAGIGTLPGTVADRSIAIRLKRRTSTEPVERFRAREVEPIGAALQKRLEAWGECAIETLQNAWPAIPDTLNDRAADVWEPLLAIAELAGADWPARARLAACSLSHGVDENDVTVDLLRDIQEIFAEVMGDTIATQALLEKLTARQDRPWATWSHGKPMTGHALARLLRQVGIEPAGPIWVGATCARGYRRAAFDDAFGRYVASKPSERQDTKKDVPELAFLKRQGAFGSDASKSEEHTDKTAMPDALTLPAQDVNEWMDIT